MVKTLVLLFQLFSFSIPVLSQENAAGLLQGYDPGFYRTGIGVRIGWPVAALTVKHFVTGHHALEFIAEPRYGGGSLTILAEKHAPAKRPSIYWYYGGGLNAGIFRGSDYKNYKGDVYTDKQVLSLGVSIVLGIEMNIKRSPVSVSFDAKPRIGILNPGGPIMEGAVGIKYVWSW